MLERKRGGFMGFVVWLVSTGVLWFITNATTNLLEAKVHRYSTRFLLMTLAGVAIGAISSAIGYTFFIISILLLWQAMKVRKTIQATLLCSNGVAMKYTLPTLSLIITATIGSYVFSIESCGSGAFPANCKRVFFERIYTPPHLQ